MVHEKALENIHIIMRDLRLNDNLMGRVLVIPRGDFLQTLPVIPNSTLADEIHALIKHYFFNIRKISYILKYT